MKTTVVIPNYNGKQYIENCLRSLEACRGSCFATIVVDNGSTDGSDGLVEKSFPRTELVRLHRNLGFSAAVNQGIARVQTTYVLLLNNDTAVEPDFVEKMEEMIEKKRDAFAVSARMLCMSDPGRMDGAGDLYCALGWAFAAGKDQPADRFNREAEVFSACAGAAIYRMSVLRRIGLFDENHFVYLEDLDISWRARIFGYHSYYAPKARVLHAGSASSGSRYNEFKIRHSSRNSIYVIYKNMPFGQIIVNLPFLAAGFMIKTIFFAGKGYGRIYLSGLLTGLAMCRRPECRSRKIAFNLVNLRNYADIQIKLWVNLLLRFQLRK